jgi:hypothetical protein
VIFPYTPEESVDAVVQLVAGRVIVHKDVEPEVNATVPVAVLGRPDSANVAVPPDEIVAAAEPFTVVE